MAASAAMAEPLARSSRLLPPAVRRRVSRPSSPRAAACFRSTDTLGMPCEAAMRLLSRASRPSHSYLKCQRLGFRVRASGTHLLRGRRPAAARPVSLPLGGARVRDPA